MIARKEYKNKKGPILLKEVIEYIQTKYKLLPSLRGQQLVEDIRQTSQLKQLWGLVLVNIVLIGLLGGLLVLMSAEPAYMILAASITFCAAAVVGAAAYSCWYLALLNIQTLKVVEAIDAIDQGVFITNSKGLIIYNNKTLEAKFGRLTDLPMDLFTEKFVDKASINDFLKLRKLAHESSEASAGICFKQDDLISQPWVIKITPMTTMKGHVMWVLDDRHGEEVQTSLDSSQSITNFRTIFENAPMGIVLLDKDVKIRATNRFFRDELYKDTIENEQSFYDLLHPSCKEQVTESLSIIQEGGTVPMPLEIQLNQDETSQISAFASRIENRRTLDLHQPKSSGVILHFFDSSQQKRLHLQLAQSQKMQAMGQLAGGIAHDFNNLLTAMIGFCDLLLLRHSPGDQSFTDIMQIKQNANRAANLVRQLLAFSKQQTLKPQMLNVTEALSELSVLLQRLVGVNVELDIKHGRELGFVKVDKSQFEQVIINLVVNARDAMNEKGVIHIKTYNKTYTEDVHIHHDIIPPGSYVVLDLEDTGSGISNENLTRIFDPFFSTKELGRGTGLGLSTVYGIVKQTGGYILVDSEVGKGSRFKVIFPYFDPEKVTAELEKQTKKVDTSDLTGTGTILLVEDEDAVRLFGARALRDKGYRVVEARDGEEALNYIKSIAGDPAQVIDLMVTDVVMPVMDGAELVKKAHDIIPDLTIIYISGYAEDSFRQKVGQEETIHFLPKPFSLKELARKVKDVLQEKKQMLKDHKVNEHNAS